MFRSKTNEQLAPINTICLIILAASSAMWVLAYTKSILMPFIIAVFFVMVINTVAKWMNQNALLAGIVELFSGICGAYHIGRFFYH